jgi:sulfatase maturation enzyme AslB (radical SAM superfamily)
LPLATAVVAATLAVLLLSTTSLPMHRGLLAVSGGGGGGGEVRGEKDESAGVASRWMAGRSTSGTGVVLAGASFVIGPRPGRRKPTTAPFLSFSASPASDNSINNREGSREDREELEATRERWRRLDLFGKSLVEETLAKIEAEKAAAAGASLSGAAGLADTPDGSTSMPIRTASREASTGESSKLATATAKREELARKRRSLDGLSVPHFAAYVSRQGLEPLARRSPPTILQVNIGLYCNQACSHCHVESSPLRKSETMDAATVAQCLRLLESTPSIRTLDITGGAPELNENFRLLVSLARARHPKLEIIDRCNLTSLLEPGQQDLIDFLKKHRVRVVASLPCYEPDNVDNQRGDGVFDRSIAALLALNEAGYGRDPAVGEQGGGGSSSSLSSSPPLPLPPLVLDLVYNPGGPSLPPNSQTLEAQYKEKLRTRHGIVFNSLIAITNMPIKRFADSLRRSGQLQSYMDLLVESFNPSSVHRAMCTDTISVDYAGRLYDCDFNQQLGLAIRAEKGAKNPLEKEDDDADDGDASEGGRKGGVGFLTVFDVSNLDADLTLPGPIRTGNHCYGCTAGMGSSCQGATATATSTTAPTTVTATTPEQVNEELAP